MLQANIIIFKNTVFIAQTESIHICCAQADRTIVFVNYNLHPIIIDFTMVHENHSDNVQSTPDSNARQEYCKTDILKGYRI